jgi:flagellar M-ring protein FliF
LRNLTALAQAAVGFDTTRGDVVQVEDLAFDDNRLQQAVPLPEQLLATAEQSPTVVKYVALLICILIVVAFGVRPALKRTKPALAKKEAKSAAKGDVKELPGAVVPATPALRAPEPVEVDPERVRMQEIFDQVTGHLKREPTQSSRLLQSWIHSD